MEKPKLLIVAGPNGSGKTSVTSRILKHEWIEGSRYYKSIANCSLLVPVVDRLYVYDNSIDDVFPQLLFRANNGKLTKQYVPIRDWASTVFQATNN
jgi:predicted ABC-type ATPase